MTGSARLRPAIRPLDPSDVPEAVALVLAGARRERSACPLVPETDVEDLRNRIEDLLGHGLCRGAWSGGGLAAFFAGVRTGPLFGNSEGVYCPLHGVGVRAGVDAFLLEELYASVSEAWVSEGLHSQALAVFASDASSRSMLVENGFGLRCCEAIQASGRLVEIASTDRDVVPSTPDWYASASGLVLDLERYFRCGPQFMVRPEVDPLEDRQRWNGATGRGEWLALREGTAIGMLRAACEGESFVSEHPSVANVVLAFVRESERSGGVATSLLSEAARWEIQEGRALLAVEFETINPLARRFWGARFVPYAYSYVRRIDERIDREGRAEEERAVPLHGGAKAASPERRQNPVAR